MEKEEIVSLLSQDPVLSALIGQVGIDWGKNKNPDIYHDLLRSVISQQLSVKAARTIYERFLSLFGNLYPDKQQVLELDEKILRSKGLSRQKIKYIKNIAAYFLDKGENVDWEKLSDEAILERLITIKGVGEWTVQMVLMFSLNRSDVFPFNDLVIRNRMKILYGLDALDKKELKMTLTNIADNWRPYRSYACKYIWAAKDKT